MCDEYSHSFCLSYVNMFGSGLFGFRGPYVVSNVFLLSYYITVKLQSPSNYHVLQNFYIPLLHPYSNVINSYLNVNLIFIRLFNTGCACHDKYHLGQFSHSKPHSEINKSQFRMFTILLTLI